MEASGTTPDVVSYNIVINLCAHTDRPQEVISRGGLEFPLESAPHKMCLKTSASHILKRQKVSVYSVCFVEAFCAPEACFDQMRPDKIYR
jgi:hypothetical protein